MHAHAWTIDTWKVSVALDDAKNIARIQIKRTDSGSLEIIFTLMQI